MPVRTDNLAIFVKLDIMPPNRVGKVERFTAESTFDTLWLHVDSLQMSLCRVPTCKLFVADEALASLLLDMLDEVVDIGVLGHDGDPKRFETFKKHDKLCLLFLLILGRIPHKTLDHENTNRTTHTARRSGTFRILGKPHFAITITEIQGEKKKEFYSSNASSRFLFAISAGRLTRKS